MQDLPEPSEYRVPPEGEPVPAREFQPVRRPDRPLWPLWMVLLIVLTLLWVVPIAAERLQYAAARGRLRAEAETARELLSDGHAPNLGDYRQAARVAGPSVVGVKAMHEVQRGPSDELSFLFGSRHQVLREQDQGSGVIIDAEGYIITNYHVVNRATSVVVELADRRTVRARIIGADKLTDIAVLKIAADDLMPAAWGDSDRIEVADPVLAIGNPFGLARTVTAGIISAKGRHAIIENLSYQDFLQTDAAINPGNSGGPLINMKGEVIGINTAIVGPTYQGIGFAIPSEMAKDVYQRLKSSGKVSRGWLGVATQPITPESAKRLGLKDTNGAIVGSVVPDSPAAAAGVQEGDVVLSWNGQAINDPMELGLAVAKTKPGTKAQLELIRDGKRQTLAIEVAERPAATD